MTALAGSIVRNIARECSMPTLCRGMSTVGITSTFESEDGRTKVDVSVKSTPRPLQSYSGCYADRWNRRVTIVLKATHEIDYQGRPPKDDVDVRESQDYVLAQVKKIVEDVGVKLLMQASKNH